MLPDDYMDHLKAVYPHRRNGQGWGYVKKRVPELIKEGNTWDDILAGAKSYGDFCRATKEEYVRMARTFYGPDEWWQEDYALPERKYNKPQEPSTSEKNADIIKFNADMKRFGK